jgi:ATP-binding cassette, subfamily B, bacterial
VKGRIQEVASNLALRGRYAKAALGIVHRAAGGWTVAWFATLVLQGIIPAGVVYLTKWLIDSVAAAVGAGASMDVVTMVMMPALAMIGLLVLQQILGSVIEWINTAQTELVQDHMKALIHSKAVEVDFGFYENSTYYDRLEQANSQATSRSLALLQNMGGVLQGIVTLVSISVILITYSILLPIVLLVSTLPALYVVVRHNQLYHDWWHKTTADRRWAGYFDTMMTVQAAAAEVRIFNLGQFFSTSYQILRKRLRGERLDLLRKQTVAKFGAGMFALVMTGGVMGWIGLRALRGTATLGDLGLFYQAFNQGQSLMRNLLSNAGQMYTNTLFLEHLFVLLSTHPEIHDPEEPADFPKRITQGIEFRNVSFSYPGVEHKALENFSMDFPAGKIVAIVGANGAGKSTLTKLLCRFYDPTEGQVLLDGVDIKRYRLADLRRQISIMFQFPMRYQAVAAENIGLGSKDQSPTREEIVAAAKGAGAHEFIERLHQGYDTLLGRWFQSGTDLSGGEWQRIALARAFLRRGEIVVLDEPTSSMDSWAENEWLRRFRKLVEGRTAIIITHRFTTAMQADMIHVMEDGNVVESGTHEELIELGGRYAASWMEQMRIEQAPSQGITAGGIS